jgi:hypothetical protein
VVGVWGLLTILIAVNEVLKTLGRTRYRFPAGGR